MRAWAANAAALRAQVRAPTVAPGLGSHASSTPAGRACGPQGVSDRSRWCSLPAAQRTSRNELIFFLPYAMARRGLRLAPWILGRWLFGTTQLPYDIQLGSEPRSRPPQGLEIGLSPQSVANADGTQTPIVKVPLETLSRDSRLFALVDRALHNLTILEAHRLLRWALFASHRPLPTLKGDFWASRRRQWTDLVKEAAELEIGTSMQRGKFATDLHPGLPVQMLGIDKYLTVLSAVSGPTDRDAVLGAMGLKSYAKVSLERLKDPEPGHRLFRADVTLGRRVFDRFDFEGDDQIPGLGLGPWSLTADSKSIWLDNEDFRDFRKGVKDAYNGQVQAPFEESHLVCEKFYVASPVTPWRTQPSRMTLSRPSQTA